MHSDQTRSGACVYLEILQPEPGALSPADASASILAQGPDTGAPNYCELQSVLSRTYRIVKPTVSLSYTMSTGVCAPTAKY
jgi:hypothetical protein